jgi:hypothetical protein
MLTHYQIFDTSRLKLKPLRDRAHDMDLSVMLPLVKSQTVDKNIQLLAQKIKGSRQRTPKSSVVLMMGAHVIRSGVQRFLIDMMERGFIDCLAMNGAGVIHDYELALIGATTESVPYHIKTGEFGLWKETGQINDIVARGAEEGLGLGEAVGKFIEEQNFSYKDLSLLARAFSLGVPVTVHVGIGYDIVHEHPNCDGAAYGKTSYTDFLIFAKIVESLSGGVIMNFGSAVMAPEVFLKALAMARNAAAQEKKEISKFTCLVCDVRPLTGDLDKEPEKNNSQYYFRPWKTMLVRTVADGGQSYYICGRHSETIPQLWSALTSSIAL